MKSSPNLPSGFSKLIEGYRSTPVLIGESGAEVIRLENENFPTLYLKISPVVHENVLKTEAGKLDWLRGRLPVPETIAYDSEDQIEYLLTSEIPGIDLARWCDTAQPETIVAIMAEGLRMLHSVNIVDGPFSRMLDKKIEVAEWRMNHGLVSKDDFDSERVGKGADELFQQLLSIRPDSEDLVFTHGDYCLPNIIVNNNRISGFVDMAESGIADRYMDLALAVRSLEFNTSRKLTRELFAMYGIDQIDWEKIEFYRLLDEFF